MKRVGDVLKGKAPPRPSSAAGQAAVLDADDTCPSCRGAGWLRVDVPFGHPFFGRPVQCECLMAQVDERKLVDLMRISALEPFREKTFENFDRHVTGVDRAFEEARKYARDPKGWLVLIGPYGSGKTHLAAAIANEVVRSRHPVLFTIVPDLLDHLRSAFAPTSTIQYDELFEGVRKAGLLVLDDLGTESATPWAREKLYQIFNHRYNERAPTVVTTNRSMGDIDDRIRSRLSDQAFCKSVEIGATDYRLKKPGERRPGAVPRRG